MTSEVFGSLSADLLKKNLQRESSVYGEAVLTTGTKLTLAKSRKYLDRYFVTTLYQSLIPSLLELFVWTKVMTTIQKFWSLGEC
jgi:hypothetical protein